MYNNTGPYGKSDQAFLRQHNTKKVLNIIRLQKKCSRIELAEIANLDPKTITNITTGLLEKGQIRMVDTEQGGYGRPREMLAVNKDYCRCIGLDLGGTHVSAVIMDFEGNILCDSQVELGSSLGTDMLVGLCDLVFNQLFSKSGLTMHDIERIGISFPGTLDPDTGKTKLAENMHNWHEIPLQELFMERYQKTIRVDDCSRLMGLAELWYGQGQSVEDFIVFDLGWGIGCGIVIHGEIFAGSGNASGEIGHMIVETDGPLCTCGRHGCIEALSSGWALSKQANVLARHGNRAIAGVLGNAKNPTPLHVALAAQLGDEDCRMLLKNAGKYIGIGIANAIALLNPKKVILGGRLIRDNAILLRSIQETAKKQTIEALYSDDLIVVSNLRDASAVGAATLCIKDRFI